MKMINVFIRKLMALCVHAKHATEDGSKRVMIKASDTDNFVIALSIFPFL